MKEKKHLTSEGMHQIIKIKKGMNREGIEINLSEMD
jgi:hypothetical protein